MKAFAVRPRRPDSGQVVELPDPLPKRGLVRVDVLEVGVCGTDSEINQGLYGEAPEGAPWLVLGHEVLGSLEDRSLVVPMVRRPCPECANCRAGSQDMCSTGAYTEMGIKGVHGGIAEYLLDDPRWLIPVPPHARPYAVLVEPMSVFAKGLTQAYIIQKRLRWEPKKALVLGAGPIGLLATLALRAKGWEVVTVARKPEDSPKAAIVRACGGRYVSTARTPIKDIADGSYDFVFEATGSAQIAFESFPALAVNGVLCLTSVTGGDLRATVPVDRLNFDLVLGNRLVFGTVNANRADYVEGLAYLDEIERVFRGSLSRLFTARVRFADGAAEVFARQREGIKTVFQVADSR